MRAALTGWLHEHAGDESGGDGDEAVARSTSGSPPTCPVFVLNLLTRGACQRVEDFGQTTGQVGGKPNVKRAALLPDLFFCVCYTCLTL